MKKLEIIDEEDMIKRDRSMSELDKIIQNIIEDKFYLFKDADILDFKKGINWEYEHSHSVTTYQLYLHSLDIITFLCNQYKATKDVQLLEKSLEILNNWIEYDNSFPKNPPAKMWCDHGASCRALTITFFYMLSRNKLTLDEGTIYDCLVKHARFLYQDDIYRPNNHGIMMDRALILLSIVLATHEDAKKWKTKALARIKEAFNRDFSHKGTHLENSPAYHILVMDLFISTEDFLNKNDLTLGEEFHNRLQYAKKYFQYLAKPNKILPMLGDSSSLSKIRIKKNFDNFLDIQAGIAIIQHLDEHDPNLSTWLTFTCGYGSKTHKHYDDLSFNLFWKGRDIFIDSGRYNYDTKNKYRSYVVSPLAHNTIAIEGLTYQLGTPLNAQNRITITDFDNNPTYNLIKGKNLNYKGKEIYRTLIFLKPDIIIVFDKILSSSNNKGLQLFNLAPHAEIKKVKDKSVIIKSGENEIEIISLLSIDGIKVYHGDREKPRAVISQKFASLTDISQIEISKKGTNLEFLTLIKLGDVKVKGEVDVLPEINFDQKINQLNIKANNHEFSLVL